MGNLYYNELIQAEEYEIKRKFHKNRGYFALKRTIDIFGSLCGIALLSPVFVATAIAVRLDSKGPSIFSQERVGQDGRTFKMYKFRSMVVDAESKLNNLEDKNEMDGPMFKMTFDPRVTRLGRFIRKTSIDELPQLFNVLAGDMSLVGPRPNLPKEVAKFDDYQKQKLIAKPGLTCYWQVMGRSSVGFKEWVEMDNKYLEDRCFFVDIMLILKTVKVLFGDKNAK